MWDRERDAALVELHSQGLSFAEIGRRIGVTRNAAISRFHWIRGTKFRSEHERKLNVSGARVHQLAARARARQLMLRGLAMLEAAKGTETGDAAESPGLIDVQAATR